MILRRYGDSVQSVALDFDSKALTEIRFRRDHERSEPADRFVTDWRRVREHELGGTAEGFVQDEVEQVLLADIEARLRALEASLAADELLVVESEAGVDYPKTHTHQKTVTIDGENRFHFTSTLRPPLRVGIYRKMTPS
jgi:hypothetical protein